MAKSTRVNILGSKRLSETPSESAHPTEAGSDRSLQRWLLLTPNRPPQFRFGQFTQANAQTIVGFGNPYLRRHFIHGACSAFLHLNRENHRIGTWITQVEARTHQNVAIVALANKLARIAWAVLAKGNLYCAMPAFAEGL